MGRFEKGILMIIADVQAFDGRGFVSRDIIIKDGKISALLARGTADILDEEDFGETIDGLGCYAIPGLIDVHSHGAVGCDFCDGSTESIEKICRFEASRGVTAWCGTTMTYPEEKLSGIMRAAAAYDAPVDAAALVGINMEGPFISPGKVGAQNPAYVQTCDAGMFRRLQAESGGLIKLVDVAPEEPGSLEFIDEVADEVRVSIAHTRADYDIASEAYRRGAKHLTHLFNAMPPLAHREPGVIGAAADAGATPEIIADGVHIHPSAVRAAFRLFGDDRMILISDSMEATGMPDGEYSLGGQAVTVRGNRATLHDGTIAGSATDLMGCLVTAVRDMDVPLASAVRAATANPAWALGIDGERGSLEAGKIADVVLLDVKTLEVRAVILRGNRIA